MGSTKFDQNLVWLVYLKAQLSRNTIPNKSTSTIEVREMKAETKSPRNKATITNDVKSGQNGNANKQIPLRIRDIFVTTSEET